MDSYDELRIYTVYYTLTIRSCSPPTKLFEECSPLESVAGETATLLTLGPEEKKEFLDQAPLALPGVCYFTCLGG
jgi:hypothetical protein